MNLPPSCAVRRSWDLDRIVALPRRTLDFDVARNIASALTPMLRRPGSTATLFPWQGQSLYEIAQCGGGFFALPLGNGKTIVSWLAALVLEAKRPWLLIPGDQRAKTYADFATIAKDWAAPSPPPNVHSYEELSIDQNFDALDRELPDLLILEEADKALRSRTSVAVLRIARYMVKHPDTMVVVLTASPGRLSILDYAHLLVWSLKSGAPTPIDPDEQEAWAKALDARVRGPRFSTGALSALGGWGLQGAREGYRLRLAETPGVVIVDDTETPAGLTIRHFYAPDDRILAPHFQRFWSAYETPDGWPLSDAFSIQRHEDELGSGFFYRWDPRPPRDWLAVRAEFCAYVREAIDASQSTGRPLDSEGAVKRNRADHAAVRAWAQIGPTFEPNSVATWLSPSVLNAAAEWLATHNDALVWSRHSVVGPTLARMAGVPYFGAKGEDETGRRIDHHKGPAVVSFKANQRGRNLQHGWHNNLFMGWISAANQNDQALGRTHRRGQARDVSADVMLTCGGSVEAFDRTLAEAAFVQATQGITQKVLRASIERCTVDPSRADALWRFGV